MSDADQDDPDAIKNVFAQANAKQHITLGPPDEPGPGLDGVDLGSRVRFPQIDPRAWEHPADRAALNAMRRVPGFDTLMRRLFGTISERSLRLAYLANSVKVSERQFSRVHTMFLECCATLDVEKIPDLFIAQTPMVNAGAIGVDNPFIVINSATLQLLDDDEIRHVLGHELGHVLSGHALYKTMLHLLLRMSLTRIGIPLAGLAIMAIVMALREWDRKSELSADRAGLLCVQDPDAVYRVQMKMAGGNFLDEMDLEAFVDQAREYEESGDVIDGLFKLMNALNQTHPFPVTRLAEVRRWVADGGFQAILDGNYVRRGDSVSAYNDVTDSVQSYRDDVERSEDPLARFVTELGQSLGEAGQAIMDQLRGFGRRNQNDIDDIDDIDDDV